MNNIPLEYRNLLLSLEEPGQVYRACLEQMERDGLEVNYALTEQIVYGCEVRYAIEVLTQGRPSSEALYNFGDRDGGATQLLWSVMDRLPSREVAFIGAGPYPVSAFLMRQRYPDCRITCLDNHLVAFLLGRAVAQKMDPSVSYLWAEAEEFSGLGFDLILIAAMVNGKAALTQRLLKTTEAQIVVRGKVSIEHPRVHSAVSTFSEDGNLKF